MNGNTRQGTKHWSNKSTADGQGVKEAPYNGVEGMAETEKGSSNERGGMRDGVAEDVIKREGYGARKWPI